MEMRRDLYALSSSTRGLSVAGSDEFCPPIGQCYSFDKPERQNFPIKLAPSGWSRRS
jgi:hypothetical protein